MGSNMETRKIGSQGLVAGAIGLGCMGMTHAYGTGDEAESIATIHRALDRGVTLLDTAEVYGPHTNEELVGKAIRGRRDEVVLATKFGIVLGSGVTQLDGSPANARRAVEGSLRRLGVDVIDLYYLHRKDPAVPIEETVGAMKELVEAGQGSLSGSFGSGRGDHPPGPQGASDQRRAERVFAVGARHRGVDPARHAGTRRGAGAVQSAGARISDGGVSIELRFSCAGDFRRNLPRFDDEHMAANQKLVDTVKAVAATPWSNARRRLRWPGFWPVAPDAVPIPGTKRRTYLDDNLGAVNVHLTAEDMAELRPAGVDGGRRPLPAGHGEDGGAINMTILRGISLTIALSAAAMAQSGIDLWRWTRAPAPARIFINTRAGTGAKMIPSRWIARWGRFNQLHEQNLKIERRILEKAAEQNASRTPLEQKIGDFYAACMNEQAIDGKGVEGIAPGRTRRRQQSELPGEFARIAKAWSVVQLRHRAG